MTSEILGDFTAEHVRQLLVVALAKLAEGPRRGDDDEIGNLAVEHPFVEHVCNSASEAVFRGLVIIGIGGTVLMARARPLVDTINIHFRHRRQRGIGFITGIAEETELLAVRDSHGRSLG